jgi:hypothetical protein
MAWLPAAAARSEVDVAIPHGCGGYVATKAVLVICQLLW